MRRIAIIASLVTVLAGAGWVAAETPAPAPPAHQEHHPVGGGGMGMMGGGPMGMGMMGGGGMCSMLMGGPDTTIAVKNVDKGVTITLTSTDPAAAKRLQKMAEAMRLMHEAMSQ